MRRRPLLRNGALIGLPQGARLTRTAPDNDTEVRFCSRWNLRIVSSGAIAAACLKTEIHRGMPEGRSRTMRVQRLANLIARSFARRRPATVLGWCSVCISLSGPCCRSWCPRTCSSIWSRTSRSAGEWQLDTGSTRRCRGGSPISSTASPATSGLPASPLASLACFYGVWRLARELVGERH